MPTLTKTKIKIKVDRMLMLFLFILFFGVIVSLSTTDILLVVLSCILLFLILFNILCLNEIDLLSPLSWFSVIYSGYVIGGLYYSYGASTYGKFISLVNIPVVLVPYYMYVSLFWAIVCYLFMCAGYYIMIGNNKIQRKVSGSILSSKLFLQLANCLVPLLLFSGFIYWVYVSVVVAGGPINIFIKFQVFPHLVKGTNISTLPYHLYYAGILLWMLIKTIKNKKLGVPFYVLSLLGALINLTQGRIMLSISFLLTQVLFVELVKLGRSSNLKKVNLRISTITIILGILAVVVYFLRIWSNYNYIDLDQNIFGDSNSFIFNIFDTIVGSGNVTDLQQLTIIFYTWTWLDPVFGITYLDWLRNTVGSFFGMVPSSIGLTIRDIYFPGLSGAPTPGAIGEAFVNFSIIGPFFMMFVGGLFGLIYKQVKRSSNYIVAIIYAVFISRFVLMYPKVDSTMFVNFIWGVGPLLIILGILYFLVYSLNYRTRVANFPRQPGNSL